MWGYQCSMSLDSNVSPASFLQHTCACVDMEFTRLWFTGTHRTGPGCLPRGHFRTGPGHPGPQATVVARPQLPTWDRAWCRRSPKRARGPTQHQLSVRIFIHLDPQTLLQLQLIPRARSWFQYAISLLAWQQHVNMTPHV